MSKNRITVTKENKTRRNRKKRREKRERGDDKRTIKS